MARDGGRDADSAARLAPSVPRWSPSRTYTAQGSAEIAGASTDLVLARREGRLHVFHRDPGDHGQLVPGTPEGKDVRDTLVSLLS